MSFMFVSALSSPNYGKNVHTTVFGFDLKHICMYACTHPAYKFVFEKTKPKECAWQLKVERDEVSLLLEGVCSTVLAWLSETLSPRWKCMTVVSNVIVHELCHSSADEQESFSNFRYFHILPLFGIPKT